MKGAALILRSQSRRTNNNARKVPSADKQACLFFILWLRKSVSVSEWQLTLFQYIVKVIAISEEAFCGLKIFSITL
jgi:hypothetical protein